MDEREALVWECVQVEEAEKALLEEAWRALEYTAKLRENPAEISTADRIELAILSRLIRWE